ncbi:MAG: Lytic transglycosylase, catalytic [Myxococcaceae bacterium]|nr:Lytic transglycosylase, catalytic [Myxococcaceae bacterium]
MNQVEAETPRAALPHLRTDVQGGGRLAIASFAAQMVFLVLLVLTGLAIGKRLEQHEAGLENQRKDAAATRERVDALGEQTRQMNAELMNLRQVVASNTSEEVLFLKSMVLKRDINPELARSVAALVHKDAQLYGRDPNLVLAIIAEESAFDPKAISNVGAVGLMQVMPHWKRVLGITGDLKDPDLNIRAGLQILGFYLEMYGDVEMALTAYNRGPGPVDNALVRGKSSNNGYAPKVLATYERLKQLDLTAAR